MQQNITQDLQTISTGLSAFENKKNELFSLVEKAKTLNIESIEDLAGAKLVSEHRKLLKKTRVEIQTQGKAMRDLINPITKEISSKEKELVAIIIPEEQRLSEREEWFENEKERIKREKAEAERKRIQEIEENLKKDREELDRLRKEREAQEELIRNQQREIELQKLEAQRNLEEENRKAQAEIDRIQKELEEEKRRQEQIERDRIAAEEKAEQEAKLAEEKLMAQPDRERITFYLESLFAIPAPTGLNTDLGKAVMSSIESEFNKFLTHSHLTIENNL